MARQGCGWLVPGCLRVAVQLLRVSPLLPPVEGLSEVTLRSSNHILIKKYVSCLKSILKLDFVEIVEYFKLLTSPTVTASCWLGLSPRCLCRWPAQTLEAQMV